MQPNQPQMKKKTNWFLIILLILSVFIFLYVGNQPDKTKIIDYSKFQEMVTSGKVSKVHINGNTIYLLDKETQINEKEFPNKYDYMTETGSISLTMEWLQNNCPDTVSYTYTSPTTSFFELLLPYLIFGIISLALLYLVMRMMKSTNNSAISFGKSRARLVDKSKVTFNDVAGCDEEKVELKEIVDFLKDPQKFIALGARIPKGFLLVGPPGTGKTLLAKAVAGESNVPFYSITGSDFVEMFVGVGASRVRDLFEQAKRSTPCIVFIDEIDAVGRQRGTGMGGGNDEREQTLNQLLVEMDGFETNSGIVVIAATNRADVLDPALLRPGRFDRQIYVYPPDVKGREAILKVHARGKPLADDVDFTTLARLTTGFTGADIELLLNEAAIIAARNNNVKISMEYIQEAVNKVLIGPQKKSRVITDEDKKLTAYHEAGHAIVGKLLLKDSTIQEVSIIPRGGAAGYTLNRPNTNKTHVTFNKLKNDIAMTMGGRAAEMLVFKDVSTGASADIKQATQTAQKMVTEYGMSALGPIAFGGGDEYFLGRDYQVKTKYSEEVASKIDAEISKLVNDALKQSLKILKENKNILDNMAELLIEKETIFASEVELLMKGKTAKEVAQAMAKKEKLNKKKQEAAREELEKIKEEQARIQKEKEAMLAAKFLQEAGIIKIDEIKTVEIKANEQIPETNKLENKDENKKSSAKSSSVKKTNIPKTSSKKSTAKKTTQKKVDDKKSSTETNKEDKKE